MASSRGVVTGLRHLCSAAFFCNSQAHSLARYFSLEYSVFPLSLHMVHLAKLCVYSFMINLGCLSAIALFLSSPSQPLFPLHLSLCLCLSLTHFLSLSTLLSISVPAQGHGEGCPILCGFLSSILPPIPCPAITTLLARTFVAWDKSARPVPSYIIRQVLFHN